MLRVNKNICFAHTCTYKKGLSRYSPHATNLTWFAPMAEPSNVSIVSPVLTLTSNEKWKERVLERERETFTMFLTELRLGRDATGKGLPSYDSADHLQRCRYGYVQCRHVIPVLNAWAAGPKYTTTHPIVNQFPGRRCMHDLKTESSFD